MSDREAMISQLQEDIDSLGDEVYDQETSIQYLRSISDLEYLVFIKNPVELIMEMI